MLEFSKLCNEFEKLTMLERGVILAEKSAKVFAKLKIIDIPGIDPVDTLAAFIIGSAVADGTVNEQEYLLMYPSLVKAFGADFDFAAVKESFRKDYQGKKMIKDYTQDLITILSYVDEEFREDIITLCLCVVAIDGRISLREKNYIKRLCKA